MTTRERKERRIEQREKWADNRSKEASASFGKAQELADSIPLGQPILVGHHSEKKHRAVVAKIDSSMRKGVDASNMAEHHLDRAQGLRQQLDSTIFSDDPDAIEALEAKVADLEKERDRCKEINAMHRKAEGQTPSEKMQSLFDQGIVNSDELTEALRLFEVCSYEAQPYPRYHLTNLGARIRTAKQRILDVRARQNRQQRAEAAGGVEIIRRPDINLCQITFAEKPDRSILTALKDAGFHWSSGRWLGPLDKLPSTISTNRSK